MVSFDRVIDQPTIVSIALSCNIFGLFDIDEYCEVGLGVTYPYTNTGATGWRPSVADWGDGVSASYTVGPIVR